MDIAQETFVKVHRYLPSFKGDSSFFTWTYRIAMNLCLDAQRRRGRSERVDLEQGDEAEIEAAMDPPSAALAGPQRQALNTELRGKIEEALASLSENHRAILLLRELEGLSYEELSRVLGIRKGTVMSRLFHARLKMQNKLRDYLGPRRPALPTGRRTNEALRGRRSPARSAARWRARRRRPHMGGRSPPRLPFLPRSPGAHRRAGGGHPRGPGKRSAALDLEGFSDRVLARARDQRASPAERAPVWGREIWWSHRRALTAAGGFALAACAALTVVFSPATPKDDVALLADNSPQVEAVDFGTREGAVLQLRRPR